MEEHLECLDKVLQILETSGFRLNKSKCMFLLAKVEYLRHVIDESGLHPTQEKVKAIQEAPAPKNLAELQLMILKLERGRCDRLTVTIAIIIVVML